jgi:alanine dehydrogenase
MAIRKPFISSSIHYEPLEETLDVKPSSSALKIAIPKENAFQENRIALTPDAVGVLINNGHQVVVEHQIRIMRKQVLKLRMIKKRFLRMS